ncbi:MAG: ubiquitin-specific protease otu1 [Chaenotheca gracillima]|nr:MAG: ubiquitin-specific protease otu1 [Chaenotheca gracillima]
MKTFAISAVALALLQFAAAQPHGHRAHRHVERAPVEVVVVEQNGQPISTYTQGAGAPPTPAPAPATSAPPAPKVQNKAAEKPAPSSGSSSSGSSGTGMTYSPYQDNGHCKLDNEVNSDVAQIKKAGYDLLRIYGTDCNQVSLVYNAAKKQGMKMFIGMANDNVVSGDSVNTGGIQSDCKAISSGINNDWGIVDTVAVGNEIVNNGTASAGTVASAVKTAKGCLSGFSGPVVTADTFVAYYNNPDLCNAGDYVAANCHPFFDGNVQPNNAGGWVKEQYQHLQSTCNGKKVKITETGWPTQGGNNGVAYPSKQNQNTVVSGLKKAFSSAPSDLIMFTAFNDMWKADNSGTNGCEKYWGML